MVNLTLKTTGLMIIGWIGSLIYREFSVDASGIARIDRGVLECREGPSTSATRNPHPVCSVSVGFGFELSF